MNRLEKKNQLRTKRAWRVRKKLRGTAVRPRLCVVKSNKHLQAQLIDDENGVTLAGVTTCSKELRSTPEGKKGKETARKLGQQIALLAKEKKVEEVIFDRGFHQYHGILAALADAAREGGLKF
ncbi:MAG: 50S ribosomal protein L18 [Verrucomicrobia bacterium]|nr:50S ribosomal protein L18 [Verrucomicrobiota bacterium]